MKWQLARSGIATLWSDRSDVWWRVNRHSSAGYLGWLNRGNLGDEAMYLAHQLVSPVPLPRIPQQSLGLLFARGGSVSTLVLGGGTLLGRREWGVRVERAIDAFNVDRVVTFGAGIEEPEFALRKGLITENELERQATLLKAFDRVGVRGPRSQQSLAELGVHSTILGDPALLLGSVVPKPEQSGSRPRILLSLAQVSDGYAPEAERMRSSVAEAAIRVAAELDGDVKGIAMEPADREALMRANPAMEVLELHASVTAVCEAIAEADLVISERLHPNIIAAALGTRFLAIGYKPKTYDFTDSVGASDQVVDSRSVTHDELVERSLTLIQQSNASVSKEVSRLSSLFSTAIRGDLG